MMKLSICGIEDISDVCPLPGKSGRASIIGRLREVIGVWASASDTNCVALPEASPRQKIANRTARAQYALGPVYIGLDSRAGPEGN
jgi:hypothetical protein